MAEVPNFFLWTFNVPQRNVAMFDAGQFNFWFILTQLPNYCHFYLNLKVRGTDKWHSTTLTDKKIKRDLFSNIPSSNFLIIFKYLVPPIFSLTSRVLISGTGCVIVSQPKVLAWLPNVELKNLKMCLGSNKARPKKCADSLKKETVLKCK